MRELRCLAVMAAAVSGAAVTQGQVTLTEWTGPAGLTAIHQPDELGFPGPQEWMTGGVGVGDFNNDGCMDIFLVGGGSVPDKLFINACAGSGTFIDRRPHGRSPGVPAVMVSRSATTTRTGWPTST